MATTGGGRSDEEIVAAFVGGDAMAFDELVTRYRRRVYAICYRYFGNAADAEDATQEAFVALLRRGASYSGTAAFSTWMYRVTTNACNDLARRRARRPQVVAVPEAIADVADPTDLLEQRELRAELTAALATLDPEHREAVLLHDVAGVPYADIAARDGVAVGTVKSRIFRAHARLAAILAEPGAPGTPPTVSP